MILPLWQSFASSSHRLAQEVGRELAEPATHTGTLDPMAEGVLVVLTGEDRFAKGFLPDWLKTYQFQVLWGVATDSGDRLGLLQSLGNQASLPTLLPRLTAVLAGFPERYEQSLPGFSARRHGGESSFSLAARGEVLPAKSRLVEISSIELLQSEVVLSREILHTHMDSVKAVDGDFRQDAVIASWQHSAWPAELLLTTHQVTTSPGTYVRQLVQDISVQVGVPALTWSITRTQNGPYTRQDCSELDELSLLRS